MFLPDHLAHDVENKFHAYGFDYKTIAHWLVIQSKAFSGKPFKHYFDMPVNELPYIHRVNRDVLKEGLQIMLPEMKCYRYEYAHSNHKLGIGTTKLRLRFGDKADGENVYGQCVYEVLKEREALE
jgi:hypothetical protein